MTYHQGRSLPEASSSGPKGYHLIYVVLFVVFLSVALVAQVLALPWRSWFPGSEEDRSLIGGVTASVYSVMSLIP
jgi:hypothetical protein